MADTFSRKQLIEDAERIFQLEPFVVAGGLANHPEPYTIAEAQAFIAAYLGSTVAEIFPPPGTPRPATRTLIFKGEPGEGFVPVYDVASGVWNVVPLTEGAYDGVITYKSAGDPNDDPSVSAKGRPGDLCFETDLDGKLYLWTKGSALWEDRTPLVAGMAGGLDATGYTTGQVPTATGTGTFQPGTVASQSYVDAQIATLRAQIAALPQQSAIGSISYQQTFDKPDDVEDGVPGEMRMVVQLITRADGSVRRVVAGYFLKLSDGTATGRWDDLVEFPAPPTGSVPLFVGIGDPDPQDLPDSLAAYIGQDPQGGGQVSLGDQTGWRDPSARLLAPDAIAGYFGTNHPSVMHQGDFYVDPTYDNSGALTNVQLVFEDGGGPPTGGGPTGPVEPAQVPAPAHFAATEKPGYVELAWDQPSDTGDDVYTQAWKAEVKPTGQPDSAYVPVALTSGTTTIPAGTPSGYMRRVSGITRYNIRDAAARTTGTALTYRLTAVDANFTHASNPVTDTATVVAAAPQVIAIRAMTPGSTAVSSLNVSLAQGTNGATSGTHGTVVGNDTRAPAAGDIALLTLDFSNVTSTSRLPTQIVIGGSGGSSGTDVGVASTRATIYTDSESQLNRTDSLYNPPAYPSFTSGTTGWSTGGANQWFVGFYPGLLWRMFERTGSTAWRDAAITWQNGFASQNTFSTHDLGFMFFLSFAEGFRLTGDTTMRSTALTAANTLSARFNATVGAMQSYDAANGGSQWGFNTIIDSVMNMELLFWAAANGGSSTLYTRALTHLQTLQTNHVRTDGGTWQVVEYNTTTGAVTAKVTNQGYADTSTWARGQAWAIHGFTMAYRYTRTANPTEAATFLATAKKCANYFLDNLPSDGVPRWDFNAPGTDLQKDTSAAAIAAAGLIELSQYDTSRDWLTAGKAMLSAISAPAYRSTAAQGYSLLLHGVSNKPANVGIDVGLIYGDYYYIEGVDRVAALPGSGGVTGGITFNMIPHDGVTGEFRTDPTNGTGIAHYVGVLQAGFPTSVDIPLPASGTSPGVLEILDPVTTDAAHTWVLRQTRYNTGTTTSASMPAVLATGVADGSRVRYYMFFDSGSAAAAGSRTSFTGATKVTEVAASSGGTGRLIAIADGGTVDRAVTTAAVTGVVAQPSVAPDFGAMSTLLIERAGTTPDPTVVQPSGTGGGTGGGGSGGTPSADPTIFPVGDASLSASGLTIYPVTATSTLQQFAPGGVFHSGNSHESSLNRRSVPVADIAGSNYYEIIQDPNGSAYVVRVRTFAGHYDYWTADAYRSEGQHGTTPIRYGFQYFLAGTVKFKSSGTPLYPRGGKTTTYRTATSSKGDWLDWGQLHGQDTTSAKYNGPFSSSLNAGKIELFRNLDLSTSGGDHPYLSPAVVLDKVVFYMWRLIILTTGGLAEFWTDERDGTGFTRKWTSGSAQTARDSGQACDFRFGPYQGPFKPASQTVDWLFGQAAIMEIPVNASTATADNARSLVTRAVAGVAL
jgi:hypothetical protein